MHTQSQRKISFCCNIWRFFEWFLGETVQQSLFLWSAFFFSAWQVPPCTFLPEYNLAWPLDLKHSGSVDSFRQKEYQILLHVGIHCSCCQGLHALQKFATWMATCRNFQMSLCSRMKSKCKIDGQFFCNCWKTWNQLPLTKSWVFGFEGWKHLSTHTHWSTYLQYFVTLGATS